MKHSSKLFPGIIIGWIACVSLLFGSTLTHHISHEENEKDRESKIQDMASEIGSGGNPTFLVSENDLPVEGEEEDIRAHEKTAPDVPSEAPSGSIELSDSASDPEVSTLGNETSVSEEPGVDESEVDNSEEEERQEETAIGTSRETHAPSSTTSSSSEEYTLVSYGTLLIPSIDCELPLWDGAGKIELRYGVGRMPLSCEAGEKGNLVIFGHRMKKKGSIFNRLDEVSSGDAIIVNRNGRSFTYIVDQTEVIEPSELSRYIAMGEGEKRITLITCTPTGVGSHRLLVIGHLSSS